MKLWNYAANVQYHRFETRFWNIGELQVCSECSLDQSHGLTLHILRLGVENCFQPKDHIASGQPFGGCIAVVSRSRCRGKSGRSNKFYFSCVQWTSFYTQRQLSRSSIEASMSHYQSSRTHSCLAKTLRGNAKQGHWEMYPGERGYGLTKVSRAIMWPWACGSPLLF